MFALMKKGLFLTPFLLFFFAADRYMMGDNEEIAKKEEKISANKTIIVQPGESINVIVKQPEMNAGRDQKSSLVLLRNGVIDGQFVENGATRYYKDLVKDTVGQGIICQPFKHYIPGLYTYVCKIPDPMESGEKLSFAEEVHKSL